MAYIDCKKCIHYKVCITFVSKQTMEEVNKEAIKSEKSLPCDLYLPASDVAEVKHGKWLRGDMPTYGGYKCSVCKKNTIEYKPPYCPNCGVKMDGGKVDDL